VACTDNVAPQALDWASRQIFSRSRFDRHAAGKNRGVIVAASTVAVVAIVAAIIAVLAVLVYVMRIGRRGRTRRPRR
jgi:hypothetical protein